MKDASYQSKVKPPPFVMMIGVYSTRRTLPGIIPIKDGFFALVEGITCLISVLEYANTRRSGPTKINLVCSSRYLFADCIVSFRNRGSSWNRIATVAIRHITNTSNWVVFIKEKDGKPQGAIYYVDAANGWFEIFGIDIDRGIYDAEVFKELLQAALSDAKHRKGNVMTFFCDEEYEKVAKECGLECIGNYLCYKTHLN